MTMPETQHAQAAEPPHRPGIVQACLLVLGVVPFMAGLLSLYSVLGVGLPLFGFVFLLYWAGILRQEMAQFLPSVIGGAGGIILGWTLVTLPHVHPQLGVVAAGLVLAAILFCFMRGHLPWLCNNAMMLFLIVATIPELDVSRRIATMLLSLALGAGYMGAVACLILWIAARRKSGAA
ncbi:MAG TPA: hypothetical protein VF503_18940 [Sphingobium sp.]|uniref:hypothetical protein n=1 Tax=Sphingobium sp. TaxID=1912891 RepID=UPI002ED3D96C